MATIKARGHDTTDGAEFSGRSMDDEHIQQAQNHSRKTDISLKARHNLRGPSITSPRLFPIGAESD